MPKKETKDSESQYQDFVQAARELGCDESEAAFDEKLRKVAAHKPPDPGAVRPPSKPTKPAK